MSDEQRSRAEITRRVALAGGSAGLAAALLAACGGGGGTQATTTGKTTRETRPDSIFGNDATFKFTIVCHQTQGSLFVPLQYGLQDACTLLGCQYDWTGSRNSNVQQMVRAINQAVSAKVDGIATTLIEAGAFNVPVTAALAAGIPVVAYNTDVAGSPRMAFIGPDLGHSGELIGRRITTLLPDGGEVAVFASTPGTADIKPRVDGIKAALKQRPGIKLTQVATGTTLPAQQTAVTTYLDANPRLTGAFAVDAGSTAALAQAINSKGLVIAAGGVDATADTFKLIESGKLAFTVEQQPYLQGFLTILQLYLYNVSQKLVGIADADTGLQLVTKATVGPFLDTVSRFQGTSSSAGLQKS